MGTVYYGTFHWKHAEVTIDFVFVSDFLLDTTVTNIDTLYIIRIRRTRSYW